jgi:hypothetical protein
MVTTLRTKSDDVTSFTSKKEKNTNKELSLPSDANIFDV